MNRLRAASRSRSPLCSPGLVGCGSTVLRAVATPGAATPLQPTAASAQGIVMGGQQPVAGVTIQLYQAGACRVRLCRHPARKLRPHHRGRQLLAPDPLLHRRLAGLPRRHGRPTHRRHEHVRGRDQQQPRHDGRPRDLRRRVPQHLHQRQRAHHRRHRLGAVPLHERSDPRRRARVERGRPRQRLRRDQRAREHRHRGHLRPHPPGRCYPA